MSAELLVELPDGSTETVVVDDQQALLIGREPDCARLSVDGEVHVRTVAANTPSVSANHLLVRRRDGATTFLDAGSRNGSWLQLPAHAVVETRAPGPWRVRLSNAAAPEPIADAPADAAWIDARDFGAGVAAAVGAWFERMGMPVRPYLKRGQLRDVSPGIVPLADGTLLQVVPTSTVDTRWGDALAVLWRYVNSQNAVVHAEEETRDEGMVLASPAIRRTHAQVVDAARRGLRVLLIGPSGAGKDLLARCYHRHAGRSGPFVAKNCAMFSRELMRAELFGAEQGSFTTAVRRLIGAVETAHAGTLFLDEIGELDRDVQPLLLTFLDRGEYERLGGGGVVRRSDARVVSATNRDLRAQVRAGEFREDLWYRLAGQVIDVPPLRSRPEDIEAYLRLPRGAAAVDVFTALDASARRLVFSHSWDGNFRELSAFAARLPVPSRPESIDERTCAQALDGLSAGSRSAPALARSESTGVVDLAELASAALGGFREDYERELSTWDDVKDCLERYLKPLLFARMTGADRLQSREQAAVPTLAQAIDADRGTVLKQLARYFDRFR